MIEYCRGFYGCFALQVFELVTWLKAVNWSMWYLNALTCCLGGQLTKFCVCVWRLVQVFSVVRLKRPNWSPEVSRAQETISAAEKLLQQLDGEHTRWTAQVCVCERERVFGYCCCVMCLSLHLLPARIKSHALTSEDIHTTCSQRITLEHKCLSCMWVVSN